MTSRGIIGKFIRRREDFRANTMDVVTLHAENKLSSTIFNRNMKTKSFIVHMRDAITRQDVKTRSIIKSFIIISSLNLHVVSGDAIENFTRPKLKNHLMKHHLDQARIMFHHDECKLKDNMNQFKAPYPPIHKPCQDERFKCGIKSCSSKGTTASILVIHEQLVHRNISESIICHYDQCDGSFRKAIELCQHLSSRHGAKKSINCSHNPCWFTADLQNLLDTLINNDVGHPKKPSHLISLAADSRPIGK